MKRLNEKLRFGTIKNRFWVRVNNIEEGIEVIEITRIKIKRIERIETEIKEIEELKLKTTEYKRSKLLSDLNFEKGLEIDEAVEIEIRLGKLKIAKTTINAIKELIIPGKYLYHIL